MSSEIPCWEKLIRAQETERDPAGRERERTERGAERADSWPLEGFPGSFWFLVLVRPSCVPAHGLWEIPHVLM